jgi:hypothetical protein
VKILVNLSRMDGVSKEVYEIESIVTFSRTRNRFFLSWQGYPPTSNTWEPFKSFSEKETPLFFLSKLKSCGIICDNCIKIAKSSVSVSAATVCECVKRSPSPIVTPGKRAIDMMKKWDAENSESLIKTKRSRSDASLDVSSPSSAEKAEVSKNKSPTPAITSRPSVQSLVSTKIASRPKAPSVIPFQEGLSLSDDDNEPLRQEVKRSSSSTKQSKPFRTLVAEKEPRPQTNSANKVSSAAASSAKSPAASSPKSYVAVTGSAASGAKSPAASSPNSNIAVSDSATRAVSNQLSTGAAEQIEDPDASSPQPDPSSPRERRVFHYRDFQNPSKESLLKSLAVISYPMEVSQEQKDALGKLNHMDIRNMGVWQSQDLLLIMKKLTMQVKTDEIKNFFVRIQS